MSIQQKLKLQIPIILPDVPDEKDRCVKRLINILQDKKGLENVHISDEKDNGIPQLCFHYNPDLISIDRIR